MKIVCFACDCYAYLAPVWEYCLYRVWPDCPYEVVYIANSRPLNVSGTVYHVKKGDADFGGRLRAFVSRHTKPGDLILLVLIDHLIRGVDITIITQAEKLCALDDGIEHVPEQTLELLLIGLAPTRLGVTENLRGVGESDP